MTIRIATDPFTNGKLDQWNPRLLGPAWVEVHEDAGSPWFTVDVPVARGIRRFIRSALSLASGRPAYGTVYAALLDGREVTAGAWHYDLGEYTEGGAARYVGTWASDGTPLQNGFQVSNSNTVQPPNNYVVEFNEGTDYHRRLPVPARPGEWGVFVSLALYRDDEPANLHCPRLADLRGRGDRAAQAKLHEDVARTSY